jgi:BioD-like phosphotransacetylase family protein
LFSVYITSSKSGNGKTSTALALSSYIQNTDKKTAFYKLAIGGQLSGMTSESDIDVIKQLLKLEEPAGSMFSIFPNIDSLKANRSNLERILSRKDGVLIEGTAQNFKAAGDIAENINARILGIEVFQNDLTSIYTNYQSFGKHLAGVIINKVPRSRLNQVKENNVKAGIKVLGVVPEDRSLLGLTVEELAERLSGEIVSGKTQPTEIVENFLVGVLNPDHGPDYYARKKNKAVIINSERADMQLSALETPTRCLILAGNKNPTAVVLRQAETKRVPIITVKQRIPEIISQIEGLLNQTILTERKVSRTIEVFNSYLNIDEVCNILGITK